MLKEPPLSLGLVIMLQAMRMLATACGLEYGFVYSLPVLHINILATNNLHLRLSLLNAALSYSTVDTPLATLRAATLRLRHHGVKWGTDSSLQPDDAD
jgi:hypothetical protein